MEAVHVTLVMLVAITALGAVARRIAIPYPILLVLGGTAIAFIPGLPRAELDPALFFALFLPPLLYSEGWLMPVPRSLLIAPRAAAGLLRKVEA